MKTSRDTIVAGAVAGAAFVSSAAHIFDVTQAAGNHWTVAAIHPLGIDGLIYIGIRAMQRGNLWAGSAAIFYGAAYSLAFNAASYGGFGMPVWALAACMPLAMFFAFLIVHGVEKPREVEVVEVEKIVEVEKVVEVPVMVEVEKPRPTKSLPSEKTGPRVEWDMVKAVEMLREGRTVADVVAATGAGTKSIQRVRSALNGILAGRKDDAIVSPGNLTPTFVARVRAATVLDG